MDQLEMRSRYGSAVQAACLLGEDQPPKVVYLVVLGVGGVVALEVAGEDDGFQLVTTAPPLLTRLAAPVVPKT